MKFEIIKLKLKLKLKSNFDKMSVNIAQLFTIMRTGLTSIGVCRVLQFNFKAIEILLFFGSVGPVFYFNIVWLTIQIGDFHRNPVFK